MTKYIFSIRLKCITFYYFHPSSKNDFNFARIANSISVSLFYFCKCWASAYSIKLFYSSEINAYSFIGITFALFKIEFVGRIESCLKMTCFVKTCILQNSRLHSPHLYKNESRSFFFDFSL